MNDENVLEKYFIQGGNFTRLKELRNQVDVIHVTGAIGWPWPIPYWFLEKTSRWSRRLAQLGFNAKALVPSGIMPNITNEDLVDILSFLRPRMIISRSFALRARDLEALALTIPDTVLIQSNHTPNSFMLTDATGSPLEWLDCLDLAKTYEKVYLSTVSRVDAEATAKLAPERKIRWIANPCRAELIVSPRLESTRKEKLTIGLSGRTNFQKNLKNQIDAVALIAKETPLDFILILGHEVLPSARETVGRYAKQLLSTLGSNVSVLNFVEPETLRNIALEKLDLFLQVTFDESFGYLNWEMMAAGVPTITSPNIDILGTATAETTRMSSIKSAIESVISDLPRHSKLANEYATNIAKKNNLNFDNNFKELLA